MTQEEKELLLKDLCARLPFEVMVECSIDSGEFMDVVLASSHITEFVEGSIVVKPYLRPMSSMTFDESLIAKKLNEIEYHDFLNAHHFDYRGLIEKSLALKAPEDMYIR